MENINENLNQKILDDKNIIQENLSNIHNFINSVNENSQNYLKFNESLFINHNKWLYDVQKQLNTAINEQSTNINLKDLYYEDSILSLLKKIAKPNNYRSNKTNIMNDKIVNYGLFKKIDELTNFNDVIDTINTCSKYKRNSLLSNIHKNDYKDKDEENIEKDKETNNKIVVEEKPIESFEKDDEDIKIGDLITSNEKNKFENIAYPYDMNDKIENSLCTIVEQPSIEEKDKNNKISLSTKNIFAPSKSNQNLIKNNNISNSNYVLQLNNINDNDNFSNYTSSNKLNNINKIEHENNIVFKSLNPFESFATPQKEESPNFNSNNNILIPSNKNNLMNLFSIEKSPCFAADIKNNDYNTKKKNIPSNCFMIPNAPQFSFGKTDNLISSQKFSNKNDFLFSTEKKYDNNFSKNNIGLSNNKDDIIVLHTSIKKGKENKFLSDIKSQNNCLSDNKINGNNYCSVVSLKKKNYQNMANNNYNNNNNYLNILTNSINKANEDNNINSKNYNYNNNFINIVTHSINNKVNEDINKKSNNNNFINIITHSINDINEGKGIKSEYNGFDRNEFNSGNKNYVQNIVLSSNKNPPNIYNNKIKIKEKYEDDFEEYEMSDSSKKGDNDEDEEDNTKFVPKWAMDEEYINERIMRQNHDKDLIMKSFGKFVVEHLNLNMIFGTHNEAFDIRNSTADWRGEDSFVKNKVTNINDNEIDTIFPNRKLQF